ncbi:hypothetical protein WJU23_15565 [Prosthecobacter sp. SYSU 5D2]|uniref:hypothetical protein n=1 Tax=Prosthecobacter sp. SYSU 5D2 TaxID=3134134 RepID=UPI0031FE4E23
MKSVLFTFALGLLLTLPHRLSAQSEVPDEVGFISTVGTTVQVEGEHWAYLLWQSSEDSLAEGRSFALYRRDSAFGNFQRLSVTRDHGDERTIQGMVPRAVKLGQDVEALSNSLRLIFQDLVPDPSLSVAARLSAVVRGTRGNAEQRSSLAFVARSHPLVAMALGQALPDRLPGPGEYKYELREYDVAAAQDMRVLGRVTVNTAAGVSLPAPGQPYVMVLPDERVKEGHLSVHLRWGTPNPLRELALKHSGFRIYRVDREYAENAARKWQNTPPAAQVLLTAAFTAPDRVRQVNSAPIYPEQQLDTGAGANGADNPDDSTTYFFTDDNDRFDTGGEPLANGAQFYYFVTALDILGRDGQVSPGRLTTICDRMSPVAPNRAQVTPEVTYVGGQDIQQFKVSWPATTDADSSIKEYHLYRWTSLEEMQNKAHTPLTNRIAVLAFDPVKSTYDFVDTTPGAPRFPPLQGQPDVSGMPFIYTVRALDTGACGSNFSPHSAPSRGTLRDPQGPAAPLTQLNIQCHDPVVQYTSGSLQTEAGLQDNAFHFALMCDTPHAETFDWAEFRFDSSPVIIAAPVGRVYFGERGAESQLASLLLSRESWPGTLYCRAALKGGRVSAWAQANINPPAKALNQRYQIIFTADLVTQTVPVGGACGSTHLREVPGTDEVAALCMGIVSAPGSAELKIYRQVDGGPMTLVSVQELEQSGTLVEWCDMDLPIGNADTNYYAQTFDEDGNPSPLTRVGPTVRTSSARSMPVPMMLPPEYLNGNKVRLKWTCSPYGIERFELWIARQQGAPMAAWTGSLLSENLSQTRPTRNGASPGQDFGIYQTGLVGGLPTQQDGAVYYVDIPVGLNTQYYAFVRAVDRGTYSGGRVTGNFSNMEIFQWSASEVTPGENVPWPARALPPAAQAMAFHPRVEAVYLENLVGNDDWEGVGVRIGEFDYFGANSALIKVGAMGANDLPQYSLKSHLDPKTLLYHRRAPVVDGELGNELLPCVLYRIQVTSAVANAIISGDTSQVSPMLDLIAHIKTTAGGENITVVHDPFICVKSSGIVGGIHGEIFLLDRQPVIAGASYAYLLVRFAKNGEIEEVLSTNTVQIP